jgi:hypothetical protein
VTVFKHKKEEIDLMKRKLFSISAILLLIITACNENPVDTKGVSEELQNRKIVRITESEIFDLAYKTGENAVQKITEEVQLQTDSLLKAQQTEQAGLVCSYGSIKNLDSLAKALNVFKINKIDSSFKSSTPLFDVETQLLDAYKYNKENKLEMQPNLQAVNDTLFVFMAPISLSTACQNLNTALKDSLQNDFQGIWSIYLRKKSIVLAIQNESGKK